MACTSLSAHFIWYGVLSAPVSSADEITFYLFILLVDSLILWKPPLYDPETEEKGEMCNSQRGVKANLEIPFSSSVARSLHEKCKVASVSTRQINSLQIIQSQPHTPRPSSPRLHASPRCSNQCLPHYHLLSLGNATGRPRYQDRRCAQPYLLFTVDGCRCRMRMHAAKHLASDSPSAHANSFSFGSKIYCHSVCCG